ncbi:hypothetical protein T4C_11745 [Trichinella pseudospiralis]|uniref:Uncharacterized protein n=1 Tax=Trichinella pseudospiralis TaxID=6337 RepID=A0A0V1GSP0_TRIPS|nr:hypothetical protein T4C_11745 [Trichinella pseudospiralis]
MLILFSCERLQTRNERADDWADKREGGAEGDGVGEEGENGGG